MKDYETKIINSSTTPVAYGQEYILPSETKRNIEGALAYAIRNGAKIDMRKDIEMGITPKVDFNVNPCGASFSASITFISKTTRIYQMKD